MSHEQVSIRQLEFSCTGVKNCEGSCINSTKRFVKGLFLSECSTGDLQTSESLAKFRFINELVRVSNDLLKRLFLFLIIMNLTL